MFIISFNSATSSDNSFLVAFVDSKPAISSSFDVICDCKFAILVSSAVSFSVLLVISFVSFVFVLVKDVSALVTLAFKSPQPYTEPVPSVSA